VTESQFQRKFIRRLEDLFPDCIIVKNDSGYQQGIPDWTIFYGRKWATLEIKASTKSRVQPNQEYFVEKMSAMSYSAFVYPENEEEVLIALQQALAPRRRARVP
jgi:hypothetical protein